MPGHKTFVIAAIAYLFTLPGCDNTPLDTTGPFIASGLFNAFRIVEEAEGYTTTMDTAYVVIAGSDAASGLNLSVNGTNLALAAAIEGQALYTSPFQFAPGDLLTLTVSDSRRNYENSIAVPASQPVLSEPDPDSVYSRLEELPVSWSDATDGSVLILLSEDLGGGAVGDTLWIGLADASTGGVSVPSFIWKDRSDTSAIVSLWQEYEAFGDGFYGGLYMRTGVITVGRVHVSAP